VAGAEDAGAGGWTRVIGAKSEECDAAGLLLAGTVPSFPGCGFVTAVFCATAMDAATSRAESARRKVLWVLSIVVGQRLLRLPER